MIKVFIDSDIVLDVLLKRPDFLENSRVLFTLAESIADLRFITSPLVIANVHYIYARTLSNISGKHSSSLNAINELLKYTEIVDLPGKESKRLLASPEVKDFEDALQCAAAIQAGADYLVTRNTEDYPEKAGIQVVNPGQLIVVLKTLHYPAALD